MAMDAVFEMLLGNGVISRVDAEGGYTPAPLISHAILSHNAGGASSADGLRLITAVEPDRALQAGDKLYFVGAP